MDKKNPRYINPEQDLSIYIKEDDDFLSERLVREAVKEEVVKEKKVLSRIASPRTEEEPIEALKRKAQDVVGSLFDRAEFLRQRIAETSSAMDVRKGIHEKMASEIEADIKEKEKIEQLLTDMTEKRNFRMDISLLRKEMRSETVRFWKDLVELRAELRELLEQHQTESKIVSLFNDLEGRI